MNIVFALLLTLAIESLVYIFVKPLNLKIFVFMSIANCVLNPTMNIILLLVNDYKIYAILLTIFEICTVFCEYLVLKYILKVEKIKSIVFSCFANIMSLFIGSISNVFMNQQNNLIIGSTVFVIIYLILFSLCFGVVFLSFINHDNQNHKHGNNAR